MINVVIKIQVDYKSHVKEWFQFYLFSLAKNGTLCWQSIYLSSN